MPSSCSYSLGEVRILERGDLIVDSTIERDDRSSATILVTRSMLTSLNDSSVSAIAKRQREGMKEGFMLCHGIQNFVLCCRLHWQVPDVSNHSQDRPYISRRVPRYLLICNYVLVLAYYNFSDFNLQPLRSKTQCVIRSDIFYQQFTCGIYYRCKHDLKIYRYRCHK